MSVSAVVVFASIVGLVAPPNATCPTTDPCGPLAGHVQRAGERHPVPNVTVLLVPSPPGARTGRVKATVPVDPSWIARAVTDADGHFVAPAIPRTRVRVIVVAAGYERMDRVVDVEGRPLRVFLRPLADAEYRTVVDADDHVPLAADVVAHRLANEELRTVPGSQSDALRGAQALPGFARPPFGLGLIVLRGAPPTQSTVMLGEHPVRRAFHTLPVAAIVPSDAIETLEIVPSNYSARYGPGSGGLVRIDPKHGRRDGHHGHAEIDLIAAGAAQEGPLGRGSYLVGGRNAHVGPVLGVVERVDPVSKFPRPTFWDYHAVVGGPVARGIALRAAVYGAGDRVEQRTAPGPYGGGPLLTYRGQMHRPSLELVGNTRRVRVLASVAVLASSEQFDLPDVSETARRDVQPSWRFEVQTKLHPSASFLVGTDGVVVRRHTGLLEYSFEGYEDGEPVIVPKETADTGTDTSLAVYGLVVLERGPVRVVPGTRLQSFSSGSASAVAVDPRLSIEVEPLERLRLRAGVGVYSQPRLAALSRSSRFIHEALGALASRVILPASLLESFEPQVPYEDRSLIALRRALHVSAGPEVDLPWDTTLAATAFARMHRADRVAEPHPDLEGLVRIHDGAEDGLDLGAELLLRKHLTRRLYGWIAYTVMKSVVEDELGARPSDFDQRHNLSIVASYGLPRRFRIGARFRLASGTPYTPVAAIVGFPQTNDGDVRPERIVFGPVNSARLPIFHQLDLRVDKRWVLSRAALAFYVDVQNVYNHENTDLYVYDWDFTTTVRTIGLPIFPSLGLRVDW